MLHIILYYGWEAQLWFIQNYTKTDQLKLPANFSTSQIFQSPIHDLNLSL